MKSVAVLCSTVWMLGAGCLGTVGAPEDKSAEAVRPVPPPPDPSIFPKPELRPKEPAVNVLAKER